MATSICERINAAINDESNGILEYVELLRIMDNKYKVDAEVIEKILEDEADHFFKLKAIASKLSCPIPEHADVQKVRAITSKMEKRDEMGRKDVMESTKEANVIDYTG